MSANFELSPTDQLQERLDKARTEASFVLDELLQTESSYYTILTQGRNFFEACLDTKTTQKHKVKFSKEELRCIEKEILPTFSQLINVAALLIQARADVALINTPQEMFERLVQPETQENMALAFSQASLLYEQLSIEKKIMNKMDALLLKMGDEKRSGTFFIAPIQRGPRYQLLASQYHKELLKVAQTLSQMHEKEMDMLSLEETRKKNLEKIEQAQKSIQIISQSNSNLNQFLEKAEFDKKIGEIWGDKKAEASALQADPQISFLLDALTKKTSNLSQQFSIPEIQKIIQLVELIPNRKLKAKIMTKIMHEQKIMMTSKELQSERNVLFLHNGKKSISPSAKEFVSAFLKKTENGDNNKKGWAIVINEVDSQLRDWMKEVITEARHLKNPELIEMIKASAFPYDKNQTAEERDEKMHASPLIIYTPHTRATHGILVPKPLNTLNDFKAKKSSQNLHEKAGKKPTVLSRIRRIFA